MPDPDPKPVFATREGIIDGFYAVMIVNHALKDYPAKGCFPWHLVIRILLDGELPTPEEAGQLNALEDDLLALAGIASEVQYVGRSTTNGMREIHVYLESPEEAHEALTEATERSAPKQFEYELAYDAEWDLVARFYDYA